MRYVIEESRSRGGIAGVVDGSAQGSLGSVETQVMLHVTKGSVVRYGVGRAVMIALLAWPMSATSLKASGQQLPASVASDLVDRALADTLELYSSDGSKERPGRSMSWLIVVVGVLPLLAIGVVMVRVRWGSRSAKGKSGAERKIRPGPEVARRPTPASMSGGTKATMQLPPHVVEILRRAEQRRAEAAFDAVGIKPDEEPPVPRPLTGGIDIVVPR